MRLFIKIAVAVSLIGLLSAPAPARDSREPVYKRGFEAPRFEEGLLTGQDEWMPAWDNVEAGTITAEVDRGGSQSVMIDGAAMSETPGLGIYMAGYSRMLNYQPVTEGTPIVRVSAHLRLEAEEAPTCGLSFGLWGQRNGEMIANVLVGVWERRGRLRSYISNYDCCMATGPSYKLGTWVRVTAIFNFEKRTVRGVINGRPIGRVPFTEGVDDVAHAVEIAMGSRKPIPNVVGYVDNLAVVAVRPGR